MKINNRFLSISNWIKVYSCIRKVLIYCAESLIYQVTVIALLY